ncbi:Uu.00g003080.m01.CDS01 [Anthostomella pinea]|uniref:Uu.00g003080.m01.CDS01 n=1 Tax=Anthostomella pinea TaxID=933095 RepID=A0AAI8VJS1_9PEZI|nr:Uu.00g003080.m01.CDS01 [Anthostomella pinea]
MAQKARKDRARANAAALTNLHIGSLVVNTLFALFNLLFRRRSLLLYVLFSIPSFICEYVLESSGRPKYDPSTNALKMAGEDLSAPGLTDYMFDVIWVTWASAVLVMFFGNWGWLLWAVVPAYGAVKGYSLFGAARGMAGMQQQQQQPEGTPVAGGNRKQRRAA